MNISCRRSRSGTANDTWYDQSKDEDGIFDNDIDDEDMLAAGNVTFSDPYSRHNLLT